MVCPRSLIPMGGCSSVTGCFSRPVDSSSWVWCFVTTLLSLILFPLNAVVVFFDLFFGSCIIPLSQSESTTKGFCMTPQILIMNPVYSLVVWKENTAPFQYSGLACALYLKIWMCRVTAWLWPRGGARPDWVKLWERSVGRECAFKVHMCVILIRYS